MKMFCIENCNELVDVIVDGGQLSVNPTTVISFEDDVPAVVRVGAGDPSDFE